MITEVKQKNKGLLKMHRDFTKDPQLMALVFTWFNPLKFDLDLYTGYYTMLLESELFLDIEEGKPIPFYDISIKQINGEIFLDAVNPRQ